MFKIAVVNYDKMFIAKINEFIKHYESTSGTQFAVDTYKGGAVFLSVKSTYDLIFIHVDLRGMDGFMIAEKIRSYDRETHIVFTADTPKDAIRGYDYDAIGYLVMPVEYALISDILDKVVKRSRDHEDDNIIIKTAKAYERVRASDILYVKKQHNYIVYTTVAGDISERGSLELASEKLRGYGFAQCNSGCLINVGAVQKMGGDCVTVGGVMLPISRSRRSEIKSALKEAFK